MVDDGDSFRTYVDELQPSYGDGERLPDGSEIEGYVVDAVIGKGGMGVVYSATHKVIGKRCAIKVLRSEVSSNQDTVQRFIQEARAVNQIGHPNIVDIFDFGRLPDGRCYHLMDLLVGESLRRRLRRGPLHASEAAAVLEGVTAALIAVHDKGFIHRDLKPDNIFLSTATQTEGATSPGEVKLLDFGLAKLMPEAGVAAFTTKTGVMLGTPEYMSPEQARAQRIDYRTDIYALGVVMFEILTGHRPFPSGPDAFTTLQYHAEEPPPSLAAMLPELPAEMVQLVDAMLAKEPGARPSLAAVRTVIKRLRTTQLPTTPASASLPAMELTPSRVGAEPLLPTGPIEAPPPLRRDVSQPIAAAGIPIDSFRPPPLPPPPTVEPHASGLALAHAPSHAGTTLGVPPPPKQPSSHPFIQTLPAPARGSRRTWLVVGGVLSIVAGIAVALVATGVLP